MVTTWSQLGHRCPEENFPRLTDQPRVRCRELRRWELFFLSLACPRTRSWAVLVRSCARLAYVISAKFLECRGVNLDINAVQERLRRVWREFGGTVGRRDRNTLAPLALTRGRRMVPSLHQRECRPAPRRWHRRGGVLQFHGKLKTRYSCTAKDGKLGGCDDRV